MFIAFATTTSVQKETRIDFERGIKYQWIKTKEKQIMIFLSIDVLFLSIDIFRESGTVFQTAAFLSFIIPRLRPGLLSLRSVLPSRQSLLYDYM